MVITHHYTIIIPMLNHQITIMLNHQITMLNHHYNHYIYIYIDG